jgi:hypothetical protein
MYSKSIKIYGMCLMLGHSSLSFPHLLFFRSALHCSNRFLRFAKREGRVSSLEIQIQIATSILCRYGYLISEENASPDQAMAETSIFRIP